MGGPGHRQRFNQPANTATIVCTHVLRGGEAILRVVRDEDGDWQFVCARDHADESDALVVNLGRVVDLDPTVVEVARMPRDRHASREAVGKPWTVVDASEQKVRDDVRQHGWHVVIIPDDDEGPGFAYSIGMEKTLGHPEIILFGLPGELMHWMINQIGGRVRDGERLEPGTRIDGLLEGAACVLQPVAPVHFRDHFGYALWFYLGPSFRALQCFWPARATGLFPWDDGAPDDLRERQPDLRLA